MLYNYSRASFTTPPTHQSQLQTVSKLRQPIALKSPVHLRIPTPTIASHHYQNRTPIQFLTPPSQTRHNGTPAPAATSPLLAQAISKGTSTTSISKSDTIALYLDAETIGGRDIVGWTNCGAI
jgi:hypothetical protein